MYCTFAIYTATDDGLRGARKYLGSNSIGKICKPMPAGYQNNYTVIGNKNMQTKIVCIIYLDMSQQGNSA